MMDPNSSKSADTGAGPKKLSGAANKRRREENIESEKKFLEKVRKISTFFTPAALSKANESQNPVQDEENGSGHFGDSVQSDKTLKTSSAEAATSFTERHENDIVAITHHSAQTSAHKTVTQGDANTNAVTREASTVPDTLSHPRVDLISSSDMANFSCTLTDDERRIIIKLGPNQPRGLLFPRDSTGPNKKRGFDECHYVKKSRNGYIKIQREWLCYSQKANLCYCQACWLFGGQHSDKFRMGHSDWSHLARDTEKHESSTAHSDACDVYDRWAKNLTLDVKMLSSLNEATKYWRKVLRRIVDVTLLLATNDLPFRAHRITEDDATSKGNFLEVMHFLGRYDKVLEDLLQRPKGQINYLSPTIQNELITLLGNEVLLRIKNELNEAPFVTIILDTTQDNAKIDQLSCVFRYILVNRDKKTEKPLSIAVKESFVGFTQITSQSAEELEKVALSLIDQYTEIDKLRGQGYDGAANMSGAYSGLQARIMRHNSKARYVHCEGHALNLVINDAVNNIIEIRDFFDHLEALYVFFTAITRWNALQKQGDHVKVTLKRVCPTRWSSRNQALDALRIRYFDVMKVLTNLALCGRNSSERNEASSLQKYFSKFSTVLLVIFEAKILGSIDAISKVVQGKQQDLEKAAQMMKSLINQLRIMHSGWEDMKAEAVELALKWDAAPTFEAKRVSRRTRMHDELMCDERLQDPDKRFKTEVYLRHIDILLTQLEGRFTAVSEINKIFQCISPKLVFDKDVSDNELLELADNLVKEYPDDLSPSLGPQLLRLRMCFGQQLTTSSTIHDATELIMCHSQAASSFTDVITAGILFLTIPVTVASAERSFSKLKLIKTYLRASTSQPRLSSLAVLSIERDKAKQLNTDEIVDRFAQAKVRGVQL